MNEDGRRGAVRSAIATKRAIRRFTEQALGRVQLERILDAGRHAGSSKNQQRWEFVVVTERTTLAELAAVGPWAGHLEGAAVAVALVARSSGTRTRATASPSSRSGTPRIRPSSWPRLGAAGGEHSRRSSITSAGGNAPP